MLTTFPSSPWFCNSLVFIILRIKPPKGDEKEKAEAKEKGDALNKDLMRRYAQLSEMEESLPKKSGTYLKIILGSVNVSFLNKQDR